MKRPAANGSEGVTPALGDAYARKLVEALPVDTLKGVRDRAILATLLHHGICREELCRLRVRDIQDRQGVRHFGVKGKRDKVRLIPVHVAAQRLIEEYLAMAGHADGASGPVFRPVTNNRTGELDRLLDPNSVYRNIVRKYGLEAGICTEATTLRVHSLRATAATNALSHEVTSPRCRSGSAMRMFRRRGSTTGEKKDPKTVLLSE